MQISAGAIVRRTNPASGGAITWKATNMNTAEAHVTGRRCLALLATAIALAFVLSESTASAALAPEPWFRIEAGWEFRNGQYFDAYLDGRSAKLVQQPGRVGSRKAWNLVHKGWGQYGQIVAIKNVNSQKCIDVPASSRAWGTKIIMYRCTHMPNQLWQKQSLGNYRFKLINLNSNLCLDVPNNSLQAGLQLIQWGCNENEAQRFGIHGPFTTTP